MEDEITDPLPVPPFPPTQAPSNPVSSSLERELTSKHSVASQLPEASPFPWSLTASAWWEGRKLPQIKCSAFLAWKLVSQVRSYG